MQGIDLHSQCSQPFDDLLSIGFGKGKHALKIKYADLGSFSNHLQ